MGRQVKVTLEGFGNRSLTALLERQDVEGKSFGEVVQSMAEKPYSGEDAKTAVMLKRQMEADSGYTPMIGMGTPNRFEPVRLDEPVERYIQKSPGLAQQDMLRTSVLGVHKLGYNS